MAVHSSGRRRMRKLSPAEGQALAARYRASGKSIREFSLAEGVREHVLRYWVGREAKPEERLGGEFFVMEAPAEAPARAKAPARERTVGSAFIVVVPQASPERLACTVRELARELAQALMVESGA